MKALSIWQPYAQLIAEGAKTIETRHWPAPMSAIGHRIAIHAGKNTTDLDVLRQPGFIAALDGQVPGGAAGLAEDLPLGAVVATAVLVASQQMTKPWLERWPEGSRERVFGWFALGRYAWRLEDVMTLPTPIPCRGMQRIFNLPPDVAAAVLEQEQR